MIDSATKQSLLADAVAQFPATFGLQDHGTMVSTNNRVFRINRAHSYVNDHGVVVLCTEILVGNKWLTYTKGTVADLERYIMPLPL